MPAGSMEAANSGRWEHFHRGAYAIWIYPSSNFIKVGKILQLVWLE